MDRESRFWDRIARRYARRPVADEASYRKKLEITRGLFRPGMEVLEFGCGSGATAIAHAPHARHIQAIDISRAMLDIARGKAAAAGVTNITFERAGIDDYAVADGSYDIVLGLSILHLLADRDAAIAKVHRLLKPGGFFVTSTTCLGDSMRWMKALVPIGRAVGLMPLVKVFTAKQLEASLTGAGFAIEQNWQPGKGKAVFIVARKPG